MRTKSLSKLTDDDMVFQQKHKRRIAHSANKRGPVNLRLKTMKLRNKKKVQSGGGKKEEDIINKVKAFEGYKTKTDVTKGIEGLKYSGTLSAKVTAFIGAATLAAEIPSVAAAIKEGGAELPDLTQEIIDGLKLDENGVLKNNDKVFDQNEYKSITTNVQLLTQLKSRIEALEKAKNINGDPGNTISDLDKQIEEAKKKEGDDKAKGQELPTSYPETIKPAIDAFMAIQVTATKTGETGGNEIDGLKLDSSYADLVKELEQRNMFDKLANQIKFGENALTPPYKDTTTKLTIQDPKMYDYGIVDNTNNNITIAPKELTIDFKVNGKIISVPLGTRTKFEELKDELGDTSKMTFSANGKEAKNTDPIKNL